MDRKMPVHTSALEAHWKEIESAIGRLQRRLQKAEQERRTKERALSRIVETLAHQPRADRIRKKRLTTAAWIHGRLAYEARLRRSIATLEQRLVVAKRSASDVIASEVESAVSHAEADLARLTGQLNSTTERVAKSERRASWDLFISHAFEDKASIVRPLVRALRDLGLSVWFDEFELRVGDSLRRSIDIGLTNSRFGVVVLSRHFFAKQWTQYELDSLVAREIEEGKVILPVWYGITKRDIMEHSAKLADKVAVDASSLSPEDVALRIYETFI